MVSKKHSDAIKKFEELYSQALTPGSKEAVDRQHSRGKYTARERIEKLLDDNSFVEIDMFSKHNAEGFGIEKNRPLTDGVVVGWGTIDGRQVGIFSQDFTVFGGALGEVFASKMHKIMDFALEAKIPIIGLNDGAGARIQEGVASLASYGGIFKRNVEASGVIPQISVILGPCAGGAVYSPAITDFVFMVREIGNMFITGPDVVKTVTGENVTQEELGGAWTHATKSGVAHFVLENEDDCFKSIKKLLKYLPQNFEALPPKKASSNPNKKGSLLDVIPENTFQTYDVKKVLDYVLDGNSFFEVQPLFAPNIVTGFARLGGKSVGIVANQPKVYGGSLDISACEKAARFVRTCDAFGIPLISFVDVPGFTPGVDQEFGGIIRHSSKLLYAFAESSVPRVQIVLRQAYGGAFVVMNSKSIGADISFALPTAEISVMHASAAVGYINHKELDQDPSKYDNLVEEFDEKFSNPYLAAERGIIDGVISPLEVRSKIIAVLDAKQNKVRNKIYRKHGNVPL